MKKIRKLLTFLAITITIITTIYILLLINNNLKSYSIYYAKNMPNTRKEIEMMVLIDNLDWVKTPELEGYNYDFDGNNAVIIKKYYNGEHVNYYLCNAYYENEVFIYRGKEDLSYWFDNKFELTDILDSRDYDKKIDIKTIDEETIKQEIYDFIKPIIDVQPEPKINLQWIFNLVYIDYR